MIVAATEPLKPPHLGPFETLMRECHFYLKHAKQLCSIHASPAKCSDEDLVARGRGFLKAPRESGRALAEVIKETEKLISEIQRDPNPIKSKQLIQNLFVLDGVDSRLLRKYGIQALAVLRPGDDVERLAPRLALSLEREDRAFEFVAKKVFENYWDLHFFHEAGPLKGFLARLVRHSRVFELVERERLYEHLRAQAYQHLKTATSYNFDTAKSFYDSMVPPPIQIPGVFEEPDPTMEERLLYSQISQLELAEEFAELAELIEPESIPRHRRVRSMILVAQFYLKRGYDTGRPIHFNDPFDFYNMIWP